MNKSLDVEIDLEKRSANKAWREWVHIGTQGNGGRAHRWTKLLDAWNPYEAPWKGTWTGRPSH
eukprot:7221267-Pyramimonas_sp.AAC.1